LCGPSIAGVIIVFPFFTALARKVVARCALANYRAPVFMFFFLINFVGCLCVGVQLFSWAVVVTATYHITIFIYSP